MSPRYIPSLHISFLFSFHSIIVAFLLLLMILCIPLLLNQLFVALLAPPEFHPNFFGIEAAFVDID